MSQKLNKIIRYLSECYKADNRTLGLFDFFGNKVEKRIFLEEALLLTGEFSKYPVEAKWATEVENILKVYSKEKVLLLSAFFIKGKRNVLGEAKTVCTPLVFIPAFIESEKLVITSDETEKLVVQSEAVSDDESEENDYYLSLDFSQMSLNPSAVSMLAAASGLSTAEMVEKLTIACGIGPIDFQSAVALKQVIDQHCTLIDTEELFLYPQLGTVKSIRKKTESEHLKIFVLIGLGLISKSSASLGVLLELEELEKESDYSTALKRLFNENDLPETNVNHVAKLGKDKNNIYVPAILSLSQRKLFNAVDKYDDALIVGPPGTGKSFTIAGLALDSFAKERSVLVVCANDQALDVIDKMISEKFGITEISIRAGKTNAYKSKLKNKLKSWLAGIGIQNKADSGDKRLNAFRLNKLNDRNLQLNSELVELEERELQNTDALIKNENKWYGKYLKKWLHWRMGKNRFVNEVLEEYLQNLAERNQYIVKYLNALFDSNLVESLNTNRKQINNLLKGIKAYRENAKDEFLGNLNVGIIKKTFPIWLVNRNELRNVLPLRKELFDLVIIDEASQCDLASILPALQRAKKVVISGDPMQLRHVSFLSENRRIQLANLVNLDLQTANDLNFRKFSLLDVYLSNIKRQDQIAFLDEHFRSHPSLIEFNNQQYYKGQLRLMTALNTDDRESALKIIYLEGERDSKGTNAIEANFIIDKILKLVELERSKSTKEATSIGVISPYRAQVDFIKKAIVNMISLESFERHQLNIGTAHSFQGDERDVVFLSLTVDSQTHPSSFMHLNNDNVFNVSTTRARKKQYVITSLPKTYDRKTNMLIQKYFEFAEQLNMNDFYKISGSKVYSSFAKEISNWLLEQEGVTEVMEDLMVAGIPIDLAIKFNDQLICFDIIGSESTKNEIYDLSVYEILGRVGLRLYPIQYSRWILEQEATKEGLLEFISQ